MVISKRLKNELIKDHSIKNVVNLPDGVDIKKFDNIKNNKNRLRKELGLPKDKILILYSGNFHPSKGIYTLLNSFQFLDNTLRKRIKYVIIGGKNNEEIGLFVDSNPSLIDHLPIYEHLLNL